MSSKNGKSKEHRQGRTPAADGSGSRDDDIDELEIAALVTGELKGAERKRALQRLIRSPAAVEKYRILTELHAAAGPARGSWLSRTRAYGLAATVVLAIGIGAALYPVWKPMIVAPADTVRAKVAYAVAPGDNAELNAFPESFQWPTIPGAQRYRVRLFDETAREIWISQWSPAPGLPIDGLERPAMRDERAQYFWIVEIEGRATQSEIGPFWFSTHPR